MPAADKIRLLAVSDWCDSGFGRVMKELLPRLARTGLFDIQMVGWVYDGDPDEYDEAQRMGIRLHTSYGPAGDWGRNAVNRVVSKGFKPEIVLTLGDPWMVDWVETLEFREKVRWVAYVPIDREPVPFKWTIDLSKPDVLVLYSEWGAEVIERQMPFRHPEVIMHGVDTKTFRPFSEDDRKSIKHLAFKVSPESFVVGCVARNQERKCVPLLFRAFKAFNCMCCVEQERRRQHFSSPRDLYSCPACGEFEQDPEKEGSYLYLHMSMGDGSDQHDGRGVSWNVRELVERFDLRKRVLATPGYTVAKGVPSEQLCHIYNGFDVHVLPTKREGFGLPVLEAMACGTPNVTTNYSASAELVRKGSGLLIDVQAWVNDPHEEADGAIVDVVHCADLIDQIFRDSGGLREDLEKRGREFAESISWAWVAERFVDLFLKVAARAVQEKEDQPVPCPPRLLREETAEEPALAMAAAVVEGAASEEEQESET